MCFGGFDHFSGPEFAPQIPSLATLTQQSSSTFAPLPAGLDTSAAKSEELVSDAGECRVLGLPAEVFTDAQEMACDLPAASAVDSAFAFLSAQEALSAGNRAAHQQAVADAQLLKIFLDSSGTVDLLAQVVDRLQTAPVVPAPVAPVSLPAVDSRPAWSSHVKRKVDRLDCLLYDQDDAPSAVQPRPTTLQQQQQGSEPQEKRQHKCPRCGEPKKGHRCTLVLPQTVSAASLSYMYNTKQ